MLLSKEIAVYLNLSACKLKQYTAAILRQEGIDLTPEQLLLVDLMWNHGSMSQQKMADLMHKDKNSITKLVDGLERKGMVRRCKASEDKRLNILRLTDDAEKMKAGTKGAGIEMLDGIIQGISEDELKAFLATLAKIDRNMSQN